MSNLEECPTPHNLRWKALHEGLFVNFLISLSVRTGNRGEECSNAVQSPFEGDLEVLVAEIDGKLGKLKFLDCAPRAKLVLGKFSIKETSKRSSTYSTYLNNTSVEC